MLAASPTTAKVVYMAISGFPIIETVVCLGKNTSKHHFVMSLLWHRHSR